MAILGTKFYDIADFLKSMHPDGTEAYVIELLNMTNTLVRDANVMLANQSTGHLVTVRDSLPAGIWTRFYTYVPSAKSTTTQFMDSMGTLQIYSTVDANLVKMHDNGMQFRMQQDIPFTEGLVQQMNDAFLYSNTRAYPEQFLGILPRYDSLSTSNPYHGQIVDGGGTGNDNTSIVLLNWGVNAVSLIYPRSGMAGGLRRMDKGEKTIPKVSPTTGEMEYLEVYCTHFMWSIGCSIADYRRVVRIANIDVSDLSGARNSTTYAGAALIDLLIDATYFFGGTNYPIGEAVQMGGTAFYANRSTLHALDFIARHSVGFQLNYNNFAGQWIYSFRGVPLKTLDALATSEGRITS